MRGCLNFHASYGKRLTLINQFLSLSIFMHNTGQWPPTMCPTTGMRQSGGELAIVSPCFGGYKGGLTFVLSTDGRHTCASRSQSGESSEADMNRLRNSHRLAKSPGRGRARHTCAASHTKAKQVADTVCTAGHVVQKTQTIRYYASTDLCQRVGAALST